MMNGISAFLVMILCVVFTNAHDNSSDVYRARRHSRGNCGVCGASYSLSTKFPIIINGRTVQITKQFPWMVSLLKTDSHVLFCGGAIISDQIVMTAAHCLVPATGNMLRPQEITIGFLSPNPSPNVRPTGKVAEYIVHPGYMHGLEEHDIALIRLQRRLTCDEYTNPICLPKSNWHLQQGTSLGITGWGSPSGNSQQGTPDLRSATIKVVRKEECMGAGFQDLDAIVCLRGKENQSPCFGDSGGSMFQKVKGKYYTFGVASVHLSPICETNTDFVYTSTVAHLNWIKSQMSHGLTKMRIRKISRGSSNRPPPWYWSPSGCTGGYVSGCPMTSRITRRIYLTL